VTPAAEERLDRMFSMLTHPSRRILIARREFFSGLHVGVFHIGQT
jgi:hypothetical protein